MYIIKDDIRDSATLTTDFYKREKVFEKAKEAIFAQSWLYIADADVIQKKGQQFPFILLEDVLDEPLLLTHDKKGDKYCLSNVCTHRGKIIVEAPKNGRNLSCGYHGRCFNLDGTFKSMPQFKEVNNFPTVADNLAQISLKEWLGLLFISLNPKVDFDQMIAPIQKRLSWLPFEKMKFDAEHSKDYYVDAHWALYCDNYLEGFHIPFVHPGLNNAIEFENYDYQIYNYCNLQLALAKDNEPAFDIPKGAEDYGKRVYAYYYWLFPNLMFNFYPWGLSLNVVTPLAHNKTKVSFRSYKYENTPFSINENRLDLTEMEDETVVESVQKGIQSRYYKSGRFSPNQEKAVHHFHQLIAKWMNG